MLSKGPELGVWNQQVAMGASLHSIHLRTSLTTKKRTISVNALATIMGVIWEVLLVRKTQNA